MALMVEECSQTNASKWSWLARAAAAARGDQVEDHLPETSASSAEPLATGKNQYSILTRDDGLGGHTKSSNLFSEAEHNCGIVDWTSE
jgi:hypothetical protein